MIEFSLWMLEMHHRIRRSRICDYWQMQAEQSTRSGNLAVWWACALLLLVDWPTKNMRCIQRRLRTLPSFFSGMSTAPANLTQRFLISRDKEVKSWNVKDEIISGSIASLKKLMPASSSWYYVVVVRVWVWDLSSLTTVNKFFSRKVLAITVI